MVNGDVIENTGSLFWIFLMLTMLVPLPKKKRLDVCKAKAVTEYGTEKNVDDRK
ncbi:MAG: hypothetical protein AEth_01255 [Candidatus Argoarchaeum ethanivorans]|uniref:Uncharacterized protein n=1 Tax=Candidatus Argoarchaeum ethanivorans TaxID=2608793 RepID=A0A8B3S0U6_9EURY|nr:MAG: hypothetical protein AEth_01255 [Candidatus Argoarchaeum ethanivorans]